MSDTTTPDPNLKTAIAALDAFAAADPAEQWLPNMPSLPTVADTECGAHEWKDPAYLRGTNVLAQTCVRCGIVRKVT